MFVDIGQAAKAFHTRGAAVGVFPNQIIAVEVALHYYGPPTEQPKIQHALFPFDACRGSWAVLGVA